MGGFCGLFALHGHPCDRDLLARMTLSLAKREERTSQWSNGSVGLAMASRGTANAAHGPVTDCLWPAGRYRIAADARLENRAELLKIARSEHLLLRWETDAELIAAAYCLWEDDCVLHLQGDYAFVLWDERQARLFGARSAIGLRSFVYCVREGRFLCASDPRPLFENSKVSRELNESWVAFWLTDGRGHWNGTIYQDIQELVPGNRISVDAEGLSIRQFWYPSSPEPLHFSRQEDYTERFRSLLTEAVRACIDTPQRILFDLSGGLDSSSLVCLAASQWREAGKTAPLSTFHAASAVSDARTYVLAVLERYPVELHTLSFEDHAHFEGAFDPQPWSPRPCIPTLLLPSFYREQWTIAKRLGASVHIRGDFGDQLVGASISSYLTTCWCERHYWRLLSEMRHWRSIHGLSITSLLEHCVVKPGLQSVQPGERSHPPWLRPRVIEISATRKALDDAYFRTACPDPFRRELFRWMRFHGEYVAQADAALEAGLETREPYAALPLIEFLLATPPPYQLRPFQRKFLLREAMAGILPEPLRQRREKGHAYRLFFRGLAKHHGALKGLAIHLPDMLTPYIDSAQLVRVLDRAALGDQLPMPALSGTLALILWAHRLPWADGRLPVDA